MQDYYGILGVERNASKEDIKKAYRTLSKKYHPDLNRDNAEAEEMFKKINEAYSVLSNEDSRRKYDNPGIGGIDELLSRFNGGFGRPRKPDINAPRNGDFLGAEVKVPLSIYLFGGKHKVPMVYQDLCSKCGGKGFENSTECEACNGEGMIKQVDQRPGFMSVNHAPCRECGGLGVKGSDTCSECNGAKVFLRDKEFEFEIPAGVRLGQKFVLEGVGRSGINGGKDGHVGILVVGIQPLDVNKLTSDQIETLKNLIEELENSKDENS